MSTLLIHNDNLPRKLINDERFKSVSFRPPKSEIIQENFSYDSFADQKLKEIFKENYDIIVIPYTLSLDNYLELTGLRVGLHIRLTCELNHWDKPIIFIGNESREVIAKLSYLGSFLFSPGVFAIKEQDPDSILKVIDSINRDWRKDNGNKLTMQDFKTFLSKIIIHPPANYQTHHSIANEWGVIRLSESIKLDEKTEKDIDQLFKDNTLVNLLYFKHIEALYNRQNRQKFRNKHKEELSIDKIKDKKIVYIDDEYHKGWELLLNYILHTQSNALPLTTYKNFHKEWEKNTLLDKIKEWLHNHQNDNKPIDAEIFIIDLRLHDDDFNDPNEISNMSGIQIIDYLKNDKNYGNPGRQVIIFTASNKIWNFKEAEKYGVDGFIMKESPEFSSTRKDTKSLLNDFVKAINNAGEHSYLKDIYKKNQEIKNDFIHPNIEEEDIKDFKRKLCDRNGWLDQYFTLLLLKNKNVNYQLILILFQILEDYSDLTSNGIFEFRGHCEVKLDKTNSINILDNDPIAQKSLSLFELKQGSYSFFKEPVTLPKEVKFYEEKQLLSRRISGIDVTLLFKICAILYYKHKIQSGELNRLIELRHLRSNICAHDTGQIDKSKRDINKDDIKFLINLIHKIFTNK